MSFRDYPGADTQWTCSRKKAYRTPDFAEKVARQVNGRDPTADVVAYGCTRCGQWHIGRRPGSSAGTSS